MAKAPPAEKARGVSVPKAGRTRRGNADRGYRSLESASDAIVDKLTELTPPSPLRILPARTARGPKAEPTFERWCQRRVGKHAAGGR